MASTAVDVLVVGGGMAGCATAAALSRMGRDVVLVDASVDRTKTLAGELIHPPGVTHLRKLGLSAALERAGAQPVRGFAVISGQGPRQLLPYSEVDGLEDDGAGVDHAAFCAALLEETARLPRVQLRRGERVVALVQREDCVEAVLGNGDVLSARLLVAADGRGSSLRKLAGISEQRHRLSSMAGFLVDAAALPHDLHGHVFIDGAAPVLAYRISDQHARLMFDVPLNESSVDVCRTDARYLQSLSPALREAARAAFTQRPMVSSNLTLIPEVSARGRVALVGDAAGCCHPVSASGLSSSAHDAVALARALAASPGDEPEALRRYVRLRQPPQRTRIALASALYQGLSEPTLEMGMLRHGLFRYWRESREARSASMGLLSTHDARMGVMAREYARVVGHSLPSLFTSLFDETPLSSRPRAMLGLMRSAIPYVAQTVRGALDGMPRPRLRA